MKKIFILLILILFSCSVNAESIIITPLEEISTSKKSFQVGNVCRFKNVKTNEEFTGNVTYYRPNGMLGQEAQIEIANFIDSKGKYYPGKITIIPNNHKKFQEFMNYFTIAKFAFIRGSEISLKPNIHQFVISESTIDNGVVIPIKPMEPISTTNDNLELLDIIEFIVINDVYKQGKLYIKKGTPIYGIVDSIDENGWCADNAAVYFKKFKTKDIDNKKITINADLIIDGFEIIKFKSDRMKQFFNYIPTFIRGKEVDIKEVDDIKFVLITK